MLRVQSSIRKWSAEKNGFVYLQIVAQDILFKKSDVANDIADHLICDITGIADPHQRVGLAKASPFVREWAEGVFVWLSKRDAKERKTREQT